MQIIQTTAEMQAVSLSWDKNLKIGFVPTMGYLHEGHLSLIEQARQECDIVVVSIYVNPAQFGVGEDLSLYPRNPERDMELMKPYEVDILFMPTDQIMYPDGYKTWIDVRGISEILCGASRPGHFVGVATIVMKLVNLIMPDLMYMGEKDYQQIAVLSTMLNDLNHRTRIVSCPIIREADGLAMSSRNVYLNPQERVRALCLSESLQKARSLYQSGIRDVNLVEHAMADIIEKAGGQIDYISCVDSKSLDECQTLNDNTRIILAVFIGRTRLIDNSSILA